VEPLDLEFRTDAGAIRVVWRIPNPANVVACNLYRSHPGVEILERVNQAMLQVTGQNQGCFEVIDTAAMPGALCAYWVEVVDPTGRTRILGPFRMAVPVA
jgi:hypothetical protein